MFQYLLVQAVGRPELHPGRVGLGENFGAAVLADVLGVVTDQPVALARDAVLDLAGRGELEALLDAALRLQFGHFRLLVRPAARRLRTATAALSAGPFILPKLERRRAYRGASNPMQPFRCGCWLCSIATK